MQEETMTMSDDEISDEVVVIDPNQPTASAAHHQRQLELQKRDQDVIDNQLKAVGLYEEGLSAEQKEELLAVIAASEETAQREESIRVKAREWQQKIYPREKDVDLFGPSTSASCQSLLQPAYVNVVTESEVENSLQMLNIEGSTDHPKESYISREKYSAKMMRNVTSKPPDGNDSDLYDVYARLGEMMKKRGPRRLRATCESEESKMTENFPDFHSPGTDEEPIDIEEVQVDYQKQKKELEICMQEWKPNTSPISSPLISKRKLQRDKMVPYECQPEKCGQDILNAIEKFHSDVEKCQRNSTDFLQWGCPITVGRAYATRSTRSRPPDAEANDGYNYHFPNISDQGTQAGSAKNSSYLRLREFDKKCQAGLMVDPTTHAARTRRSVSNQVSPTVINSRSTRTKKCETITKPECMKVPESTKLNRQNELMTDKKLASSHLTKSESTHLSKVAQIESCEESVSSPEMHRPLCKQRKSLSESDFSKNGPVSSSVEDCEHSEELIESCDSPIIVVDDDPFEEQENVCMSEKGTRRKRVSPKVPVSSPSKRIHL